VRTPTIADTAPRRPRDRLRPVYDRIGVGYRDARRADPRIASAILAAIGDAARVVNVGAGTGNYEPTGRDVVIAVEPARAMLEQRRRAASPAVRAVAEALPFPDHAFDVALAVLTVHHWRDLAAGLSELRRVAHRQVLYLFDTAMTDAFWLVTGYFPEILELGSERAAPSIGTLAEHLDVDTITAVPVPADCVDGFAGCYWNRPEAYLDPAVRAGMSSFAQLDDSVTTRGVERLRADLRSGAWDARYGELRSRREYDLGYRLVICGRVETTGE
jgi:SAM-dependent methyltransferase